MSIIGLESLILPIMSMVTIALRTIFSQQFYVSFLTMNNEQRTGNPTNLYADSILLDVYLLVDADNDPHTAANSPVVVYE
jgi:lipid-A-disaccharide synthase-like uncharacterized protein